MKNNSLGVCTLTLALLAFQLEVPPASAGDVAAGKVVYNNKCMLCHGADGSSATGYAKAEDLTPRISAPIACRKNQTPS